MTVLKDPVKKKQAGVRLKPELIKKLKHIAIDQD